MGMTASEQEREEQSGPYTSSASGSTVLGRTPGVGSWEAYQQRRLYLPWGTAPEPEGHPRPGDHERPAGADPGRGRDQEVTATHRDLMADLLQRVQEARDAIREREAKKHREEFGDYWASRQDDPPEWWDEDPEYQLPAVDSKIAPEGEISKEN